MSFFSKSVKVVKDQFFTLALAATFIGFSAFKYAERFAAPESGWYQIQHTGSGSEDNPQNQEIVSFIGEELESEECSITQTLTPPCAVYLDMSLFPPNEDPINKTVDQADGLGAEIDPLSAGSADGYARQVPEN
ncbi:hypothetical protein GCM10011386_03040 [Parapedobacter defluvii]|uniref:Uncharacterized protein n=1 Tax=Parapedobacter defluvii TaxID=2045106 RepID=A0ABQ1L0V2_9SPHI|nr:hypothetical protein [Parapedobacter defluvii]GGC14710.1 hypothetical protein GCM10011386_03040 [Parapedobacter defluvii]